MISIPTKKAESSKSSMAESQNTQSARTDELSTNSAAKVVKKNPKLPNQKVETNKKDRVGLTPIRILLYT